MRASSALLIVFKRTGGRAWLKPWGFKGLTQTQKANRRKRGKAIANNREVLTLASNAQWSALRAAGELPHWGEGAEVIRQRKLNADRKWRLWRAVSARYMPTLQSIENQIIRETNRCSAP
jgi:hypothetical protein